MIRKKNEEKDIEGIVKVLEFCIERPRSLAEFKKKFQEEWDKFEWYLEHALISGLVLPTYRSPVKYGDKSKPIPVWQPEDTPQVENKTLYLRIHSEDVLEGNGFDKDSNYFFSITDRGMKFLLDHYYRKDWKKWTIVSIIIAIVSLIVSGLTFYFKVIK